MSYSYERIDRQQRRVGTSQRTTLNYWLPLGLTVATAAVGFAAWAWNERREGAAVYDSASEDDGDVAAAHARRRKPGEGEGWRRDGDRRADASRAGVSTTERREEFYSEASQVVEGSSGIEGGAAVGGQQQDTVFSRVSDVIKRTPSPQQFFDGASKRVAAGVAAAGAVVGRGLSTLRESEEDFRDHDAWSAEAAARSTARAAEGRGAPSKRKRMVAVVVSAEAHGHDADHELEHASILSHMPLHVDSESVDLVVLIYAPELTGYPLSVPGKSKAARSASSTASSFEDISAVAADDETVVDDGASAPGAYYSALQASALRLVPHPTHIIPFTTRTGHVHLLRHLSPALVYIQEDLCGATGDAVQHVEGWVGQIVVVIGESLAADTETETEDEGAAAARRSAGREWWRDPSRVGLGKADVVETSHFEEDWIKRVGA